MKKKGKIIRIIVGIFLAVFVLVGINFIPTWNLKTANMKVIKGKWIDVYYETEKEAALDVFELADGTAKELVSKLDISEKPSVNIYIYDNQKTMQQKKYGLIGPLLSLDWYIGDNIGTNVILTSPANPGPVHDYDDNKQAVLHEMTHAYITVINPKIQLWLTEGTALYLGNGYEFYREYLDNMSIPSFQDIKTSNPIKFANICGYDFSTTYIEYLDKTYGWDKVIDILTTEDYDATFGKSEKEIYEEWVNFIKNYEQ